MIPKLIHYCWLSDDPFPQKIQECIDSWKKYLPDYEFVHWDKERLYALGSDWAIEAFENKKYAFAADYIRCYSVYNFGGIYLDTDVEVCKSLNPLLKANSFMGIDSKGDLEAAVFGAIPRISWIKEALDYYENRHFVNKDGSYNIITMPIVFKNALNNVIPSNFRSIRTKQVFDIISLYPKDYFSPKDYMSSNIEKTNNTYTIHHFTASWKSKEVIERENSWWWKTIITPLSAISKILEYLGGEKYRKLKNSLWSKRISY